MENGNPEIKNGNPVYLGVPLWFRRFLKKGGVYYYQVNIIFSDLLGMFHGGIPDLPRVICHLWPAFQEWEDRARLESSPSKPISMIYLFAPPKESHRASLQPRNDQWPRLCASCVATERCEWLSPAGRVDHWECAATLVGAEHPGWLNSSSDSESNRLAPVSRTARAAWRWAITCWGVEWESFLEIWFWSWRRWKGARATFRATSTAAPGSISTARIGGKAVRLSWYPADAAFSAVSRWRCPDQGPPLNGLSQRINWVPRESCRPRLRIDLRQLGSEDPFLSNFDLARQWCMIMRSNIFVA